MNDKYKIAHLQLLPLLTGVQNVTISELSRLNNNFFDKYVICQTDGPLTKKCSSIGVKSINCNSLVREISLKNDLLSFCKLLRIFRENKFDIVHTHSSKTGVLGRIAAKIARVPLVVHTVHGFAFPAANTVFERHLYLILEWIGAKLSDKIICLHETDYNICIEKLGVKPEQLEIIPNGIDIDLYCQPSKQSKMEIRNKLDLPVDARVVGMVGRLWKQKNPQALLNSALQILENNRDVYFLFVGDGELREHLEQQVSNIHAKHIRFLGWRDDTEQILKALDIFVLPSLWEGMPLAIIEALSTGLPCVVSDIPGNNHLVDDGYTGYLFPLDNGNCLTSKIQVLLDDEDLRLTMGVNGRNKVSEYFDIVARVNNISSLYEKFLSNTSPSKP